MTRTELEMEAGRLALLVNETREKGNELREELAEAGFSASMVFTNFYVTFKVWKRDVGSPAQAGDVLTVEEGLREFPSDHLRAQIALLTG